MKPRYHISRISFLLLLVVAGFGRANAQYWLGYSISNYSGTHGMLLNPASIADNRYKFYLNVIGVGFGGYSDFVYYKTGGNADKTLLSELIKSASTGESRLSDANVQENLNGKDKNLNVYSQVRGPSLMLAINQRHSIGISTRIRSNFSAFNVSEPIARIIKNGTKDSSNSFNNLPNSLKYGELYSTENFSVNGNLIAELGFSYAAVVMDEKEHFLKVGATYRRVRGLYSFYVSNPGKAALSVYSEDSTAFLNTNLSYGYTNEGYYMDDTTDELTFSSLFKKKALGKGNGFDLGFVYEYRPDYDKHKIKIDGEERWNKETNKYKFRVGASVLDIGNIKYQNNDGGVNAYKLRANRSLTWGSLDTLAQYFDDYESKPNESGFVPVDSAIEKTFGFDEKLHEFKVKLPTALNLNVDVLLIKRVYLNVNWTQSLRKKSSTGMRQASFLSLTPRYEQKNYEFAVPVVISQDYSNFDIGVYGRIGPFYIGSDNLSAAVKKNKVYGADLYLGICVPIRSKNPRDRDKDGVSDKKDECKKVPGLWEFKGCPDTDGDGIEDAKDECKEIPGKAEYNGCPDTDNDGVEDRKDSCVNVPGRPEFNGCPDTDGDGIEDAKDECPDKAGLPEYHGCPDTDDDDVEDRKDLCPTEKGKVELQGCPDRDNDNITDAKDQCPDVAGPPEMNGCPDTDGDGIPDNKDLCPLEKGTLENNGCPKVEQRVTLIDIPEEEQEILREAYDNLEFDFAKATIRERSFASLDELAELMKKRPEYKIYITGHTDNVGNAKKNVKLSKDRANAIKTYLTGKGIEASRILTEGFGSTRPIADNKTEEGRQKNRRVEFKVIK